MDRYGYVSNNYSGHAMAGQTRAIAGSGGCGCSSHHHHKTTHMQATQPATCQCHMKGGRPPVIMSQPMMQGSGPMIFSQEGRDWTTGICGCFEHCASCMCAFCCTPCFACYVSNKMNENVCGPLCCSSFVAALRTRLRAVNDIEGSVCKDMCACMCCPCCVLSQMYREIKNTMDY